MKQWKAELSAIAASGLWRQRVATDGAFSVKRKIKGREVLSFNSNDYLGLASDERVVAAFHKGVEKYGVGSGSSFLLSGYREAHEKLEEKLAIFTGRQRALLFSTAYMANLAVLVVLGGRRRVIIQDRLNHASLIDAAILSGGVLKRFRHCDLGAFAKELKCAFSSVNERPIVVAVESIFSMEGSLSPLPAMAELCQRYEACLVVDDAHGFGVLGKCGAGATEHFDLDEKQVPALVGAFGKACGTFGAFVAGSEEFIELLTQKARPYIYTTAPPAALACATSASLSIIAGEPWRREALKERAKQFCKLAQELRLPCLKSDTAIQSVIVGSSELACKIGSRLLEEGIVVSAIRPPTVPRNTARLRISLSAKHNAEDVERLALALANVFPRELLSKNYFFPPLAAEAGNPLSC